MTSADLSAFHRAVRRVHGTRSGAEFSANLLGALREIIGADIALVDWNRCRLHGVKTAYDPGGSIPREVNEAVHRHLGDNPIYGRRNREAAAISDHLDRRKWHRTALYNEAYGMVGQEDGLAIDLGFADGCMVSLGVTRGRRGFSAVERLQLTLLGDHVADTYRRLETDTGKGHWLEVHEDGSYAWPPEDRGARLLSAYFNWSGRRDRLPSSLWQRIRSPHPTGEIRESSGAGELRLRWIPSATGGFLLHLEERAAGEVKLTRRENEVLHWLGEGKTNAEIAILLGIRQGTVKRHLENLYAKLGVENRHAAARWQADRSA